MEEENGEILRYSAVVMQRSPVTARWTLAIGLATVLLWFGADKFIHPLFWIGWIPSWMEGAMRLSREAWLPLFAVTEILIAILLVIPLRRIQYSGAMLTSLYLSTILTQTGFTDIGIRDFGLMMGSLALLALL